MTGDDLVTLVTQAATEEEAHAIAATAPAPAVMAAADLLYLGDEPHGIKWYRRAVVREARS